MVLVILTDFSEAAGNAAAYAAGLSRQLPVDKVVFYHSIDTANMATELPLPTESERKHLYEVSARKLRELKAELQGRLGDHIPVVLLTDERPLELSAAAVAEESDADLVLLGARHRNGLGRLLHESTASMVAEVCTRPVLVIPENCRYEPIRNIVFATDLRQVATVPAPRIKLLRGRMGASLFILNISGGDSPEPDRLMAEQAALHALFDDDKPEIHYSPEKHVVAGILRFVSDHDIQLVITVPRRHSFVDSIFHPGITKTLVSESGIPLLLLHPGT